MAFTTHIGHSIAEATRHLNDGNVIGMPTETVYGLAGNAYDATTVLKIFEVKNRPSFDPLIVHTHAIEKIADFAELSPAAIALFEQFSPGPLTLLLPKKDVVPDLVTSGLPQVAVRIPKHDMALSLLQSLNFPLAAPSANPFGYISPTTAQHVFDQLSGKIPYILEGGACAVGVESTILSINTEGGVHLHRLGGLSVEAIERVVGQLSFDINNASNPAAPGMLLAHYAPRKPLFLKPLETAWQDFIEGILAKRPQIMVQTGRDFSEKNIALIQFGEKTTTSIKPLVEKNLSVSKNMSEAAQNLFAILRGVDASAAEIILAESVPNVGLGRAINDRLWRAATHL